MKYSVFLTFLLAAFGGAVESAAQNTARDNDYPRPQLMRKRWQKLHASSSCANNRCSQRIVLSAVQRTQRVLLHLAESAHVSVNGGKEVPLASNGVEPAYELLSAAEQEVTVHGPSAARLLSTGWIEVVPATYIRRVTADTVPTGEALNVTVSSNVPDTVELELRDGAQVVATAKGDTGQRIWLRPAQPRYWSPNDPHLYRLYVKLGTGDEAESYAAMRTLSVAKDAAGIPRVLLNNQPFFAYGILISSAADPNALLRAGFNTVRQQAVQSARWYAECDRLGLVVWHDFPAFKTASFRREALAFVESLRVHPSIFIWTLFDAGNGQEALGLDAARALAGEIVRLDPTRLVNGASGWFDTGNGHIHDMQFTPGPGMFLPGQRRAVVLGKFGGLKVDLRSDFRRAYRELMGKLSLYRAMGLSGAIYAPPAGQSLLLQLGEEWLGTVNRRMLANAPQVQTLAGGDEPLEYTLAESGAPREGWRAGSGIFGKPLRNIQPGVVWTAPAIRLRRNFQWKNTGGEVYLVYWAIRGASIDVKLNGERIALTEGQGLESAIFLPLQGKSALREGDNQLTVDARRESPDAAFEVRMISVTGDKFGFADSETIERTEYPINGLASGTADLARFASQFSLVRSRRGRPPGVPKSISFIREMPAHATPEQLYYALLAPEKDGFDGVAFPIQADTETARIESELKIRNIQEWVKKYTGKYPILHVTSLTAAAFARKSSNAAILFAPTPEKPRPPNAVALYSFPGSGESWQENLRLLMRAAQSQWPLAVESDGSLFAYATYLLGVESKSPDAPVRLAVPLGELDPHFFWPIGDPTESTTPGELDRFKIARSTIYRRRFTSGLVAVNPGPDTQALHLDASLMDAATRQIVVTVELPPRSAKILLHPGTPSGPR